MTKTDGDDDGVEGIPVPTLLKQTKLARTIA